MNILSELNALIDAIHLPVETGFYSEKAPIEYVVLVPLMDVFEVHANNRPSYVVSEVRIALFSKGNYQQRKKQLTSVLINADFTITERRYVGHESETGYHNYVIDVAKTYRVED